MMLLKRVVEFFLLLLMLGSASCSDKSAHKAVDNGDSVSLHTELGGDAEGYERACGPREFVFPDDHGAHPGFRNEWWYVTGNLQTSNAKRFGFHATFFRVANKPVDSIAVAASDQQVTSEWATDEFYMAHFALAQQGSDRVRAYERFGRAAVGLAGATVNGSDSVVRVWLDDWQLRASQKSRGGTQGVDDQLVWQLQLKDGADALDLTLSADKPAVLQGDKGYSQKSADPCNSSYYYSLSRLQATGKVVADNQSYEVSGSAWLDREWSSSALADDQIGWDWFALQLNDGRDLMFYQLRKRDGTVDPHSHAVEIDKSGQKTVIPAELLTVEIDRWWHSESGARYPVSGTLHRADTDETVVYRPLLDDQELDLTVRYWEGAIELSDEKGRSIGHGYLELTGY